MLITKLDTNTNLLKYFLLLLQNSKHQTKESKILYCYKEKIDVIDTKDISFSKCPYYSNIIFTYKLYWRQINTTVYTHL